MFASNLKLGLLSALAKMLILSCSCALAISCLHLAKKYHVIWHVTNYDIQMHINQVLCLAKTIF